MLHATKSGLAVLLMSVAVASGLTACAGMGNGTTGNPSPVFGRAVSQDANQRADVTMNRTVDYVNAKKSGPRIIVLPGDVKSNNVLFTVSPNNIADYGEIELTRANFKVLERTNLGPLLREMELAFNMSDPRAASRVFQKGRLQTTRWVVQFDVLKAESVARASSGFSGYSLGRVLSIFGGGSTAGALGSTVADSVETDEDARVWVIGMRYKILDANSTEQVATGYIEEKMETGASATSVMGVRSGAEGGVTLDSAVQRLVQRSVAEIDARHK